MSQNVSAVSPGPPIFTPEQLAALPHDDAGTMLNAVMWSLVGFSAIFVALRIYCKRVTGRLLFWDDYILLASWICLVLDCAIWSVNIGLGYGKHSWDIPPENISQIILYAEIAGTFAIVAAIWSKSAFAITLIRISTGWMKYLIWFLLISMNIFLGLSAVFNFAQCVPLKKVWHPFIPGKCWPIDTLIAYHLFSGIWSAMMDLTLAILPWKLIWGTQMLNKEKFGIGVAMSMGFFACITSALKVSVLHNLKSQDIHDAVPIVYFGALEISTTIVGVSIPVLRVLFRHATSSGRYYRQDVPAEDSKRRRPRELENQKLTNSTTSTSTYTMPGIEMEPYTKE